MDFIILFKVLRSKIVAIPDLKIKLSVKVFCIIALSCALGTIILIIFEYNPLLNGSLAYPLTSRNLNPNCLPSNPPNMVLNFPVCLIELNSATLTARYNLVVLEKYLIVFIAAPAKANIPPHMAPSAAPLTKPVQKRSPLVAVIIPCIIP